MCRWLRVSTPEARIAKGPVSVRDIAGLYVYENTLAVLEVTGQQLKDALEHSAKYYKPYVAGKPLSELIDEKIPAYNFDIAEGVTYELDISKPIGQRIQNLRFRGQPSRLRRNFASPRTTIASTAAADTRCTRTRRWFIARAKRFAS